MSPIFLPVSVVLINNHTDPATWGITTCRPKSFYHCCSMYFLTIISSMPLIKNIPQANYCPYLKYIVHLAAGICFYRANRVTPPDNDGAGDIKIYI